MLAINIPADGLFLAVLGNAQGDLSAETCARVIESYINRHLEAKPDIIFLNDIALKKPCPNRPAPISAQYLLHKIIKPILLRLNAN